jgi:hypothetical protein
MKDRIEYADYDTYSELNDETWWIGGNLEVQWDLAKVRNGIDH